MTTALNPSNADPIDWLRFKTPITIQTFPLEALPIAMQSAVRDRQQDIFDALDASHTAPTAGLERVAIRVDNPRECLVSAIAAHTLGCDLFLCDPHWSDAEYTAVLHDIQPTAIVRNLPSNRAVEVQPASLTIANRSTPPPRSPQTPNPNPNPPKREPYWAIPTGGTSGKIRFACHTWQTLAASAIGVRDFFQRDRLNSFCCLPVFHVSGLAQFVRAIISGGQLALARPSALRPEQTPPDHAHPDRDLRHLWLSLVPTQLQRLIDRPEWLTWLQQFDVIFLGGAPAWAELLDAGRSHRLRLAPTFGMTETASQIATLHPDDFLAGRSGCGRILPHAELTILPDGLIAIHARSLFRGYYDPTLHSAQAKPTTNPWKSDDLGYVDAEGFLHVVGRASQKIITGGENVYPEAIEAAILATGLVQDVAVVGLADRAWGQIIVAVYVPLPSQNYNRSKLDRLTQQLHDRLAAQLARYKLPKRWHAVDQLPRNDRGKLNRSALTAQFSPSV